MYYYYIIILGHLMDLYLVECALNATTAGDILTRWLFIQRWNCSTLRIEYKHIKSEVLRQ